MNTPPPLAPRIARQPPVFAPGRFRAAIFDMDGTLIQSESTYLRAWEAAAAECGRAMPPALYGRLMGLNATGTLAALEREWNSAGDAARFLAASDRHYAELVRREGHGIRPGIVTLLERLTSRQLRLAVATSSSRRLALTTLAATGLDPYFSVLVGGDEVTRGKPDPEIYLRAAARLRVAPADCVAFEDSDAGLAAAQGAGIYTIVVPELAAPTAAPAASWRQLRSHSQAPALFA